MKIFTSEYQYYVCYSILCVVYPVSSSLWLLFWRNWRRTATCGQVQKRYAYLPKTKPSTMIVLAVGLLVVMLTVHMLLFLWNVSEIKKGLWIAWVGSGFNCLGILLILKPFGVIASRCLKPRGNAS